VDAYHFISKYLQANTHKLGLAPDLVPEWLIEPAIDLSLFQPSPKKPRASNEPFRVLSVSRLAWEKGYEFAVDAIAKVHAAGVPVEYSIVGEGPYREPIIHAARQHGLWDSGIVRLVGAVPREAVVEHYRSSHALLHAALEEGFCNAVIEAQAMELPVVSSDVGGLPENVADGITGYVVRQRDADAMAARLITLAHDDRLRQELGRAGRARAIAHFNLANQIPKFCALYQDMARRPPRKSQVS
jgi:colanic acid/amylovoran biosynthesis glycosyltransferase